MTMLIAAQAADLMAIQSNYWIPDEWLVRLMNARVHEEALWQQTHICLIGLCLQMDRIPSILSTT